MLTLSLPDTLTTLLAAFAPCFTAPTMPTFQALVAGFLAQPGLRTVTGMLAGAGLAGRRHHDLAYRFFASARWSADQLGLVVVDLITHTLIPAGTPLLLATDDTLWRRSGRRLHGAAWHHDSAGPGQHRPAWGHRWVVVGVILHLPFLRRAVCLPILARLWIPASATAPHCSWPASCSTWSLTMPGSGRCTWSATPPTSASPCGGCPPRSP
jgi:DDE superfamily endonuclease